MENRQDKPLTNRERLSIKILFVILHILSGRSFEGGLNDDVKKLIEDAEKMIKECE